MFQWAYIAFMFENTPKIVYLGESFLWCKSMQIKSSFKKISDSKFVKLKKKESYNSELYYGHLMPLVPELTTTLLIEYVLEKTYFVKHKTHFPWFHGCWTLQAWLSTNLEAKV